MHTFAKFVDQPMVIKAISEKVPLALTSGAITYAIYDTYSDVKNETTKKNIKSLLIIL